MMCQNTTFVFEAEALDNEAEKQILNFIQDCFILGNNKCDYVLKMIEEMLNNVKNNYYFSLI